jgi:two-component system chemotaxis sensor kinase CheA
MAATMGYTLVADLAHELETVLDSVRRGEMSIEATIMDTLFRSADVLEQAVEAAVAGREGDVVPADLIAALRALTAAPAAPRNVAAPSSPAPSDPASASGSEAAATGAGELVRIWLQPETPLRGVRAFLIVQALATIGEVVSTTPPIAALQNEDFDNEFSCAWRRRNPPARSSASPGAVGDVFEVQVGEPARPARGPRRLPRGKPARDLDARARHGGVVRHDAHAARRRGGRLPRRRDRSRARSFGAHRRATARRVDEPHR